MVSRQAAEERLALFRQVCSARCVAAATVASAALAGRCGRCRRCGLIYAAAALVLRLFALVLLPAGLGAPRPSPTQPTPRRNARRFIFDEVLTPPGQPAPRAGPPPPPGGITSPSPCAARCPLHRAAAAGAVAQHPVASQRPALSSSCTHPRGAAPPRPTVRPSGPTRPLPAPGVSCGHPSARVHLITLNMTHSAGACVGPRRPAWGCRGCLCRGCHSLADNANPPLLMRRNAPPAAYSIILGGPARVKA